MTHNQIPSRIITQAKNEIQKRNHREQTDWKTAFNIVKRTTHTSNFEKNVAITKEALSELGKEKAKKNHREYLKTKRWKKRRKKKLEQENYTCERCGDNANQCHHTTYRHLDSSNPEAEISTLMAVCTECHSYLEDEPVAAKAPDEEIQTAPSHLDKAEHKEQLDNFNKQMIEDLKELKEKEEEQGELESSRRRWFNQEIENLQQQIKGDL